MNNINIKHTTNNMLNNSCIVDYFQASGIPINETFIEKFSSIRDQIPEYNGDDVNTVIGIKDTLLKLGFKYGYKTFLAHEVVDYKMGNCLGLPILISALQAEFEKVPNIKVIVSPQEVTYEDEQDLLEDLKNIIRYDRPQLATEPEDLRWHRCIPLEHLVIDIDGSLIDTTLGETHVVPKYESGRSMTFKQALGCIYQDRAVYAIKDEEFSKANELIKKGLEINIDNRELHYMMANLEKDWFNDSVYENEIEEYKRIGGEDSLYYFNMHNFNDDPSYLETALSKYPSSAMALSKMGRLLQHKDPGEAKVQYAIASHLCAHSAVLELSNFYIHNARQLGQLFGNEMIAEILEQFEDNKYVWGTFGFHNSLYLLLNNQNHRAEAKVSVQTPLQNLKHIHAQYQNGEEVSSELNKLDKKYSNSRIFKHEYKKLFKKEE